MNNEGRSNNDMVLGFLCGAAVGACLGLLYAPAAGEETRRRVSDTAKRLGGAAKERFGDLRENVSNRIKDVRTAADAGRDAYRHSSQRTGSMSSMPSETTPT